MRNIILTLLGMTLCVLSSCDNIDESNRYIQEQIPDVGRKVLVEEFTGQLCVNCPDGHTMLSNILNVFGEQVVVVSIHAGSLADGTPGYGLKTPEGDTYANAFNIQAYPSIVVDHHGHDISNMAQWQDAVKKCLGQNTSVGMNLSAKISEDGKSIAVHSELMSNTDVNATLQLWVTESKIVTFQQEMHSMNTQYVHNHVYRASVNGTSGESVALAANKAMSIDRDIVIDSQWNKDNLSIVAFLYDGNGVIQVEETKPVGK